MMMFKFMCLSKMRLNSERLRVFSAMVLKTIRESLGPFERCREHVAEN